MCCSTLWLKSESAHGVQVDDIPTNRIRLLAAFVRAFQSPQAEAIFLDLTSDAERCNWLVEAFGSASHVQCHWRTFLARYGMPDNSSMKLDRLLKTPTDCFFSGISWDPDMLMPLEKDEGLPSLIPLEIVSCIGACPSLFCLVRC